MPRMKRVTIPGYPHHIVQRGVRSMDIFFEEQDRVQYLHLLQKQGDRFDVHFLAYCLMTNHVHLLADLLKNSNVSPEFFDYMISRQ